jgi:hypothetical protein
MDSRGSRSQKFALMIGKENYWTQLQVTFAFIHPFIKRSASSTFLLPLPLLLRNSPILNRLQYQIIQLQTAQLLSKHWRGAFNEYWFFLSFLLSSTSRFATAEKIKERRKGIDAVKGKERQVGRA